MVTASFNPTPTSTTPATGVAPRTAAGAVSPALGSMHNFAAGQLPDPLHMQVMRHGFGAAGGNFTNWHYGAPAGRNAHGHAVPDAQGFGYGGEIT